MLATTAGVSAWVRSLLWFPAPVESSEVVCAPDAPALPRGESIKVLVWNVQYAGSRKHHFFYDGGLAVHVPSADVEETLDQIAAVVKQVDPDIILWQELDRDSDRTANIDEHAELLRRIPYGCHVTAPYHRAGYVPAPGHEHLGKVDMHLAVWSRYRINQAVRVQLPLLDEPVWRQWFNLRRAVQDVSFPIDGGGTLRVLNTHLSAFSQQDGTLGRQIEMLHARATELELARSPWLLAGDFNALPVGDHPSRLGDDAMDFYEADTPIKLLFDRFSSVIPEQAYASEPQRWRTYLPPGATVADRTLDYAFVGRTVSSGHPEVLPVTDISDHQPLVFEITLNDARE